MNIKDLYARLSYGPLQNLAMSGQGSGDIIPSKRESVTIAANEALLRLYSQFLLKENDCVVRMLAGVTNYHLKKRFALMTMPQVEKYPYILDLPLEPFEEDVIKVLAVYTSAGQKLKLNDPDQHFAVFTPQATILQVPRPDIGGALSVSYQARHTPLVANELEQPIELPEVLEGAFLSYVAFQIFSGIGTAEANAKSMEHHEIYTKICNDVIDRELVATSNSSRVHKFITRGFV